MTNNTLFVDVVLPLALPGLYTYRVPNEMVSEISIGKRCIVQFGRGKMYSVIIVNTHHLPPKQYEAKYVEAVVDKKPVVTLKQLELWNWISSYYMATLGEVMKASLPSGLRLSSETNIVLNNEISNFDISTISDREQQVLNHIIKNEIISLKDLIKITGVQNVYKDVKQLFNYGIVDIEEEIKQRYKPKKINVVELNPLYKDEESLRRIFSLLEKKSPKQLEVLMKYLVDTSFFKSHQIKILQKSLLSALSSSAINQLIKKEVLIQKSIEVDRIKAYNNEIHHKYELNEFQLKAFNEINTAFDTHNTVLFKGVTGSGKTEVYIELIERFLKIDKTVLFLVPEIALTTQLVTRLKYIFGDTVGVYHSKYSSNERVEVWNEVIKGNDSRFKLIIGPRSSLFLPFTDLGLVIVDEEHESSYKQNMPAPKYHGRDLALYLANTFSAKTLLGSATPSIESYFNAENLGKYGFVELNKRHGGVLLPEIFVSDIKTAYKKKEMQGHFSPMLINAINQTVENNQQVILFQNRRGYNPLWECEVCAWTPKCNRCDVSLTYHKYFNHLRCHYCGNSSSLPSKCGGCGSDKLSMLGFGTEQIEEELIKLYPKLSIARMDTDTMKSKNAFHNLISDFENGQVDILIGTQMVAKGLDFDNVGLVGVMQADQLLNIPDFRAFEKAYQMLSQVSGRAGRKDKRGNVVIQTFQPNHWVIQQVVKQDFEAIYKNEILERRNFNYPPFYKLIKITIKHRDKTINTEGAKLFAKLLKSKLNDRVLGPEKPYVSKIKNFYLEELMIKFERDISPTKMKFFITDSFYELKKNSTFKALQIKFDVDPI